MYGAVVLHRQQSLLLFLALHLWASFRSRLLYLAVWRRKAFNRKKRRVTKNKKKTFCLFALLAFFAVPQPFLPELLNC
jgi:hypothetical protein